jgi:Acyl-CoA dehydrogenase, C-terminal domain
MTAETSTRLDPEMLDMVRVSLHHVLTETSDRPLADRLADLGWDHVVAQDPSTAWRTLFEIKGETLSETDALGPNLARHLAEITGDESLVDVAIALRSPFGTSAVVDGGIRVDAVLLSPPHGNVIAYPIDGRLALCPVGDAVVAPLDGIDETAGLQRVTGTVAAANIRWIDGDAWNQLVARGRWLVACELVGIGRHVITTAVEYTTQRVQYGKAIGTFQALQHRVASAHAMVVGAGHLASEAGDAGNEWNALVAKCMAGQAAEFACTQAQQCYGAIGFTWEHEFHRYLKRTYTLDRMFGDWRSLEHEIGMRLQESGAVPRIGVL